MSGAVRDWLPPAALEDDAVRRLVDQAIGGWADKWFARARPTIAALAAAAGPAPPRPGGWRFRRAVATFLSTQQSIALAGLALGAEPEQLVLAEADRDLIGRFADLIAADFGAGLEVALGVDPAEAAEEVPAEDPFAGAGGLSFTLADRDKPLLDVAILAEALVPVRKAACPGPGRRPALPARLGGAIAAGPVRLEARLGAATLPLGDLASLAIGDVLILDRPVEDGAELVLGGSGRPFARAAIVPGDSEFSLLLLPQQRD